MKLLKLAPNHETLVIHPDDTSDTRSVLDKFKHEAAKNETRLFMKNSNSEVDEIVREFNPDLVLVCGWYSILSGDVLTTPRLGTWGIHHSLLPRYRGFAPLVWAIINGEEKVGSTFFRLNSGMDSGDVLFQVELPIASADGVSVILTNLEKKVLDEFENYLPIILAGEAKLTSQNDLESSFFPKRTSKDGEINWSEDAVKVHNFIRAQSAPYPGAFSYLAKELIFFEHQLFGEINSFENPGTILSRDENYLKVKTGNQSFVLVKVDFEKTNINVIEILQVGVQFNGLENSL
jgi:methionyl-tRNA formyltransferase